MTSTLPINDTRGKGYVSWTMDWVGSQEAEIMRRLRPKPTLRGSDHVAGLMV